MIKLYAFYSIGGYKDLYLGELSHNSSFVYYLPLLAIMKKQVSEDKSEKIVELDALPKIQRITQNNTCGFPDECSVLFSHGGYIILYKTLNNGCACLALRNLLSSTKDEEGRSTPFNLLFVSTDEAGNETLDNVAEYCLCHASQLNSFFSSTIVYDGTVNGIRADLAIIFDWISTRLQTKPYSHEAGEVNYVMVDRSQSIDTAVKEQYLKVSEIDAFVKYDGSILKGAIKRKKITLKKDLHQFDSEKNTQSNVSTDIQQPFSLSQATKTTDTQTGMAQEIHSESNDVSSFISSNENKTPEESNDSLSELTCDIGGENKADTSESGLGDSESRNIDTKQEHSAESILSYSSDTTIFGIRVPLKYLQWILSGAFLLGFLIGFILRHLL